MRYFRRILSAALSAALLVTGVCAAEGSVELTAGTQAEGPVLVWGTVQEIAEGRIRLENSNDQDPYREIVLVVGPETAILDAVTGAPRPFADLQENETLYAYVGPAMTMSLPPVASAQVVLCGIPADFGAPTYAEVQAVRGRGDGGVDAYVTGDVILHLSADTELTAYRTKNIVGLDDIRPGVRLLSWYDIVTLSLPAQATPAKVLVFPYGYEGYVTVSEGTVSLDGEPVGEARTAEGQTMVPVRALAEALDCTVTWQADTNAVSVVRGEEVLYRFVIGSGTVERDGGETVVATFAENGVTFMPLEALAWLHALKVETPWP